MSIYLLFLLRCSNGVHFRAIALSEGEKIHLINRKSITEAVATMRSVAQDTFTDGRGRFSRNGRGVATFFFPLSFKVVASLLTNFFLLIGSLRQREKKEEKEEVLEWVGKTVGPADDLLNPAERPIFLFLIRLSVAHRVFLTPCQ